MPPSESRFRFSVLSHDFPFPHWDLMLEPAAARHVAAGSDDKCLLTWRLPCGQEAFVSGEAERLPNHRRRYLDFEGPLDAGRGEVRQIETAWFSPIRWDEAHGIVELELFESRFGNRLTLIQTSGTRWTCRFDSASS